MSVRNKKRRRGSFSARLAAFTALLALAFCLWSGRSENSGDCPELLPLSPLPREAANEEGAEPRGERDGGANGESGEASAPEKNTGAVFLASRMISVSVGGVETVLDLEDYVFGAVAGEMPASFGIEALAAQAAAARTFAVRRILGNAKCPSGCAVCSEASCCQAYSTEEELRALWGEKYEENTEKIRAAVRMTEGMVLTYSGEPISAVYHASSGELTSSAEEVFSAAVPYLVSVESLEGADAVKSEADFTIEEAEALIKTELPGASFDGSGRVEVLHRSESGRATEVDFEGEIVSANALRRALSLKSTAFTIGREGETLIFTCEGYGHGVGMSQTGAEAMARAGVDHGAILAHFYPGTKLECLVFGDGD